MEESEARRNEGNTLRFATVSISSESKISVTGQKRSCHVDTWPSTLLRSHCQSKCLRRRRDDSKANSQTWFSFSLFLSIFRERKCSLCLEECTYFICGFSTLLATIYCEENIKCIQKKCIEGKKLNASEKI